jgi:hypothetical protein
MTLSTPRVRYYLREFNLEKLFIEELGWDRHSARLAVEIDDQTYALSAIAEKRGVQIFQCQSDTADDIPDYATRRKIDTQVTRSAYEHLIIFVDAARTMQIWQWVSRQPGQPAAYREHHYHPQHHAGDALIQKLEAVTFPLSEEEGLTLTGVAFRLRDAFDRDRITKRFYDHFKREHAAFLAFIKGITGQGDKEWYASLMLNRLIFVYFIQRKGFLDGDPDYLQNRLRTVQQRQGKGKFLTFYRYFLLRLFHEGFAQQPTQRTPDLEELLGEVPYLNGGLFELHTLEQKHAGIDIPDEAFEQLFAFFDQYDWHLDTRPLRNDREINPDVLGYIFEKYINQKQMGAYYTKEDITKYIAKNTVVPYLFDAAQKKCAIAFQPDSALWRLLRDDPDRYIYEPARKGVDLLLPEEITRGMTDVNQRGGWNRPAAPEFALPTETWREHVARRQRCHELRNKLQAGEVHQINDLITYNLDLHQFAEDVITNCEGPELLRACLSGYLNCHSPRPDLRLWCVSVCRPQHPGAALRGVPGSYAGVCRRPGALRRTPPSREVRRLSPHPGRSRQAPQPPLLHPQIDHCQQPLRRRHHGRSRGNLQATALSQAGGSDRPGKRHGATPRYRLQYSSRQHAGGLRDAE